MTKQETLRIIQKIELILAYTVIFGVLGASVLATLFTFFMIF